MVWRSERRGMSAGSAFVLTLLVLGVVFVGLYHVFPEGGEESKTGGVGAANGPANESGNATITAEPQVPAAGG